jgi:hypothetical protein
MKIHCLPVAFAILLAGCTTQERIVTRDVMIPVPAKPAAPDWLMVDYKPEALPEFVSPADPAASSALTADGERALRLIILDLQSRLAAWREWAR